MENRKIVQRAAVSVTWRVFLLFTLFVFGGTNTALPEVPSDGRLAAVPSFSSEAGDNQTLIISSKTPLTNLKEEPSASSFIIGTISSARVYTVIRIEGEWYQVKNEEGVVGWVRKSSVKTAAVDKETKSKPGKAESPSRRKQAVTSDRMVHVVLPFVNVLEKPARGAYVIGTLQRDENLPLLAQENGYYKVAFEGGQGWIPVESAESGGKTDWSTTLSSRQSERSGGNILRWAKWGCLALGTLSSGAAAYYHTVGNDRYKSYQDATATPDAIALYDQTIRLDQKRDAMFIAAGVNGGLYVLFALLDRSTRMASNRVSVSTFSEPARRWAVHFRYSF
ncbi:MAG TPA: SH3 domain-containing protein [bacterium]|nr:SH3 domain-containing protein [bacterium]